MDQPWDQWRKGDITDPNAFDENGIPHHQYCLWCGTVTRGPHAGEVWPVTAPGKIDAADDERTYTAAEAEQHHKLHNVGSTVCPTCYDANLARWRAEHEARQREQAAQQQTDQPA